MHVQACLSDTQDHESRFQHCGCPVRLLQACLCAGNTGAVKHVEACLSARDDRESSFHRCGGRVQACLCVRNSDKVVLTSKEEL